MHGCFNMAAQNLTWANMEYGTLQHYNQKIILHCCWNQARLKTVLSERIRVIIHTHIHTHTLNSVRALWYAWELQRVKTKIQPMGKQNRWSAYSRQPVRNGAPALSGRSFSLLPSSFCVFGWIWESHSCRSPSSTPGLVAGFNGWGRNCGKLGGRMVVEGAAVAWTCMYTHEKKAGSRNNAKEKKKKTEGRWQILESYILTHTHTWGSLISVAKRKKKIHLY